MAIPDARHYRLVVNTLLDRPVVPLLGAGANLCGRPPQYRWTPGEYLPSGGELSEHLAEATGYPGKDPRELGRVAQYMELELGSGPLYDALREILDRDYEVTPLHRFLAALPAHLRWRAAAGGDAPKYQLIVTTNYDDLLERAFHEAEEPFDTVVYLAEGEDRGKFYHTAADGADTLIDRPNEYHGFDLGQRTVILKIHGAVARADESRDSYVITEDHYVDYLTRTDIAGLLPVQLVVELKQSHFLFLGYSLRDWNLRVILHRIWAERSRKYKSWSVQLDTAELDRKFWQRREVEILDAPIEEYVRGLEESLELARREAGA